MRGLRTLLSPVRRPAGALWSAALTAGAAIGTLCLLVTLVAPPLGVRPLIFLSGSMSPTISAGSLGLARVTDAEDLEVGDIITVPSNGSMVTHRIVEITRGPGRATVLLKGDGNKVADATAHEVTSAPRTFLAIPRLGSAIAWFSHPPGIYVLAAWVALVLGSARRRRGDRETGTADGAVRRPKLVLVLGRLFARPA